ncbi:MAG: hypothetical protein QOK01_2488 [Alphaproteobacteria bacterium]|jgi:hypothetical protein|nr:hypothetical protein [Alphaproteobacteria bacterium]
MNSSTCSRATRWFAGGTSLAAGAIVLLMSSVPVRAVSCEDVRSLTRAEQIYWSKRLKLTAEQKNRIWLECYGQARVTDANKENNTGQGSEGK